MKFKKVEIQAFRAYDKVENGTFDFSDQETGEIADFISIYAPNGFGKTSFYDAVEWGFTNNINRFLRKHGKNADAAKAERTYKADFGTKEKQHIIRNKFSDPDLEGFVRLSTTVSDKTIVNTIPDVRSGQPDFKFKLSETKKGTEYFQDVLLSQEWIDAFLKEDDSNIRYEKFITYFGDKNLDEYYKNVVGLIKANDVNITSLKTELQKCQLKLNFEGDKDILKKINSHIDLLNQDNLGFRRIDTDFTDKDFLELSDLIDTRMLKLNFSLEKVIENEKKIESLLIGSTEEAGIAEYIDAAKKIAEGIKQLNEFQNTLKQLLATKTDRSELDKINRNLESLSKLTLEANQIKSAFGKYVTQIFQQAEVLALSKAEGEKLVSEQNKLLISDLQIKRGDERIKIILAEIEEMRQQFVNPELEEYTRLELISKQSQFNKELEEITKALNGRKAEKSALSNGLAELKRAQSCFIEHKFSLIPQDLRTEFAKQIASAEKLIQRREKILFEIDGIQRAITQQELLSEDIQQFILRGAEIVNNAKSNHCPLCDSEFESFEDLTFAINNNTALSQVMQALIEERSNKGELLDEISNRIVSELKLLADRIDGLINNANYEIKVRDELIEGLDNQSKNLQKKIEDNTEALVKWSAKLQGLTPDHFNSNKQTTIDLLTSELLELQTTTKNIREEIAIVEKSINDLKNSVAEREETLRQLREDLEYSSVVLFFRKQFPGKAISLELLDELIAKIQEDQKKADSRKSHLTKSLETSNGQNLSILIDEVNADIVKRERLNSDLLRVINKFEQSAESLALKFERSISLEHLEFLLKDEMADLKKRIEMNKVTTQNLLLLKRLQENVMPYLNHQKFVKTADGLEKRIKLLRDKIGKNLCVERDRISKFIHEQVESFFYEDLINVLYRKVDPHPEYKKIKFKCDFSNDKPKLNVFVTGENGDNPLVPNLYFSTAQMNILSLSIFLAKALNAEDNDGNPVNCIFIDDPIQSMDSINILSTIDLFRSIVVKFNKQIILSTHDENFHNLLRKKIPASLFNAKYIELETFGTVRSTY
ncbi:MULTISPECIES: hypothetical protein [Sphingobacterium]|uniref:hypothetical protein n=1 Tax=Sphingobacterium TaxID=28453 RepID=UPI00257F2935|nr:MULTISPECIES: hypothetical protein [Sphingobacterium]